MLDIKFVRDNPDAVKENIKKKFQDAKLPLVDEVLEFDQQYREAKTKADSLRGERNALSKQIGGAFQTSRKIIENIGSRGCFHALHFPARHPPRERKAVPVALLPHDQFHRFAGQRDGHAVRRPEQVRMARQRGKRPVRVGLAGRAVP